MSKLIICALIVILGACAGFHNSCAQKDEFVVDIPLNYGFNPWVLDVENGNYFGRAFVANGYIWSAEHIFVEGNVPIEKDLRCLGLAPMWGLDICTEQHVLKDLFYYRNNRTIDYLINSKDNGSYYVTTNIYPIIHGDSGYPVFCLEHHKIVGIVCSIDETGYLSYIRKLTVNDIPSAKSPCNK